MSGHPGRDRQSFPDLPILDELGHDLERAFRAQEERRPWWRRRRPALIAVGVALAVLLVPSAIATKSIWSPSPDTGAPDHPVHPTAPVQVASGSGVRDAWRLSVSQSTSGLCVQLYVAGAGLGGGCSADVSQRRPVSAGFAGGPHDSFVYGSVLPAATSLEISGAGTRVKVPARAPDPELLRRARIDSDFKLFVATVPHDFDPAGMTIVARDGAGRVVGRYPSR